MVIESQHSYHLELRF